MLLLTDCKPGRWLRVAGVVLYCLWSLLLIAQDPGFQYDEALMVLGSVHMLNSPGELTLPHDPDTWICAPGRCFPLMTVRYVGAIKEYLCLPLFAIFGAHAGIVRVVSMLLGALGIWGLAALVAQQVSSIAGAFVALLLAIHPAYVDLIAFDNGAIAVVMGALGLLCLGLSSYLRHKTTEAAFWLGAAMGFGIWARANFVWVLAALFCALVILELKPLLRIPLRHVGAAAGGAVLGGLPFLAYQIHSKGGTWQALGMFTSESTLRDRLLYRLQILSEVVLSDREHRAIWDGPAMPEWQRWAIPAILLTAGSFCLILRDKKDPGLTSAARIAALTFLFLAGFLFLSKLPVAEHHLILLVPLAAVIGTLGFALAVRRFRWAAPAAALMGLLYAGCAIGWQVAAVRGLARTGGVGQWSDSIYDVAADIQEKYPDRQLKILDWGLANNLYIITQGRMRAREVYGDATREQTEFHRPWIEEIQQGGVFLLNGPDNRQFPDASAGFLKALDEGHPRATRRAFPQRNGRLYAEIIDIEPNSLQEHAAEEGTTISMTDEHAASALQGFYQVEENSWRWTKRHFSITIPAPGRRLKLELYIPDTVIQKLGPMHLRGVVNGHLLAPATYSKPGEYVYGGEIQPDWLTSGPNRFDFELDKSLPPAKSDGRELGVIVKSVSLRGN